MAIMLANTYAALKAAGAPEADAQAAAEEIAAFETRRGNIEKDLRLMRWMIGGIYLLEPG